MKNKILAMLAMSLVTLAAALIVLYGSTCRMSESYTNKAAGNNPGFEAEQNGMPANWLVYTAKTAGSGKFTIATDNEAFHSGNRSLKFDVTDCSGKGGRFSPGIAREYDSTPGTYIISFWVKNNGARAITRISGITATTHIEGPTKEINPDTTDWTQHILSYTLPDNMKRIRFEFNVLSPGTLWIDDVEVTRMP